MPIPKTGKIAIGLLSSGGLCGGAIYGYTVINSTTIKETLKDTLIKENESKIWGERVPKLGAAQDSELSQELKTIKGGVNVAEAIKTWCYKNIDNKFSSEKDTLFKQIQLLCTYDIKDKITVVKDSGDKAWNSNKNNEKLKGKNLNELSAKMQEIKAKLEKVGVTAETDALQKWCKATYNNPFKGEQDQEYLDAKEYCQEITT